MYFRKIIFIANQNQTHEVDLLKATSCDFQFYWTESYSNYQFTINKTSFEYLHNLIEFDQDFIDLDNINRIILQNK